MLVKIVFWVLALGGLTVGLTLGLRGDLIGLFGVVVSNVLVFLAFGVSVISRGRGKDSAQKRDPTKK